MSTTNVQPLTNVRGRMSYTEYGEGDKRREHIANGTNRIVSEFGDMPSRADFITYCECNKYRHPNAVNEGFELRISWSPDELNPNEPWSIPICSVMSSHLIPRAGSRCTRMARANACMRM